jgi:predicted glycoside hydrolase/deacetylase ChbG (UPF0249 family)
MAGKTIALCADDYGLSYGVSAGILKALEASRITAVSALTNGPRWPAMGRELARRGFDADVGLHFNLTLGQPLGSMPKFARSGAFPEIGSVIMARRLPLEEINAEIERQLDRFEAVMERPPDFVDGHQHVQVLPGIREGLLKALERRGLAGKVWLRDSADYTHRILFRGAFARKALMVRSLASGFHRAATWRRFAVNDGFSGFSDFSPGHDYGAQFASYLRALGKRHLIMCHPGHVDDDLRALDPVTVTREQELAFLLSSRFTDMLEARGVTLTRLSRAA